MIVRERQIQDVTVVDIEGRITDDEGADILRDTLQRLARGGRMKLLLNLEASPYIDSTALGQIAHCYTTVMRRGGSLKLLHVRGRVRELLTVTKLLSVFDSFDTESEAVASFGGASV